MPLPKPLRFLFRALLALLALTALLLVGASLIQPPHDPSLEPAFDAASARPMFELPRIPRDPERRAFFGDLHIHTALSPDAYVFGVRAMPTDAYRFAKGTTIEHGAGYPIQISRPLDFAAVTDHSTTRALGERTTLHQRSLRDRLLNDGKLALTWTYFKTISEIESQGFRTDGIPAAVAHVPAEAWQATIAAAEAHNEPGVFTAFIAYEWSSFSRDGGHLHRNVIYGSSRAPEKPFSATDSFKPRGLWEALDRQREAGIPVLAIPHNPNLSVGETFDIVDKDGNAFDAEYAATRRRNEPLTEIFQVKGTSETHPVLSSGDEFADFEIHEMFLGGEPEGLDRRGSYIRAALRRGLELADAEGYNPFDFGVIGSSDGHGASSPVEEDNFFGKLPMLDGSAATRLEQNTFVPRGAMPAREWGAAGLAGIWAEENTRESLFAAMRRKETFATSGPRMRIRLFGGWNFDAGLLDRSDAVRRAYADGVPMGDVLGERGAASAPGFLVWAVKDAEGANLDRLQIVKGWVNADGASQEKIFDVAASDGREPDAAGKLTPLASSVDLATASYSNDSGATQLSAFWQDPEFDAAQRAFYYARVIEIPTPRWSTYDAVKLGIPAPTPHTLQERAVTSAIWYDPAR
jgi:hypothetical protein